MWIIEEEIDRNPLGELSGQSKGHVRPAKGRRLSVLNPRCGVVMEMKALRSILNLLYCPQRIVTSHTSCLVESG